MSLIPTPGAVSGKPPITASWVRYITTKGTPEQIDALIYEEVTKLGRKEGGLMFTFGLYPGVPLANIKALMDALSRYAFYYS